MNLEKSSKFCIIYSTFDNLQNAEDVSKKILEERLAACANIISGTKSMYLWENKLQTTEEYIVIFKTTQKQFEKASEIIKQMHSYKTPCVLKIAIDGGNEEFLDWISQVANQETLK